MPPKPGPMIATWLWGMVMTGSPGAGGRGAWGAGGSGRVWREVGEVRAGWGGAAVRRAAGTGRALVAAAGQLDEVDPERLEHRDPLGRVVGVEPAALEVGRVELDRDGERGGDAGPDRADHVEQQPCAVVERPAPLLA